MATITPTTPIGGNQPISTPEPKPTRAYLPFKIGEPVPCPKPGCNGVLTQHKAGEDGLICWACNTERTAAFVDSIRYRDITGVLYGAQLHGLKTHEAIVTPAMIQVLKKLKLTTICWPSYQNPYATDTVTRPCPDCSKTFGGILITNPDGHYQCTSAACRATYPKHAIDPACPVCQEILLYREGRTYCPVGDVFIEAGDA